MKRGVIAFLLASAVGAGGCAGLDPWGEFGALPESRSHSFRAEIDTGESTGEESPAPARAMDGRILSLGECVAESLERSPRTPET